MMFDFSQGRIMLEPYGGAFAFLMTSLSKCIRVLLTQDVVRRQDKKNANRKLCSPRTLFQAPWTVP